MKDQFEKWLKNLEIVSKKMTEKRPRIKGEYLDKIETYCFLKELAKQAAEAAKAAEEDVIELVGKKFKKKTEQYNGFKITKTDGRGKWIFSDEVKSLEKNLKKLQNNEKKAYELAQDKEVLKIGDKVIDPAKYEKGKAGLSVKKI